MTIPRPRFTGRLTQTQPTDGSYTLPDVWPVSSLTTITDFGEFSIPRKARLTAALRKAYQTREQISGFTRCQTEQAPQGDPGKTSDAVISSHIFKLKNPLIYRLRTFFMCVCVFYIKQFYRMTVLNDS